MLAAPTCSFFDPKEVLVDEALNGRWESHDQASISEMVASYEKVVDGQPQGQLQAVQVRRLPDKRVKLVFGYRRYNAALEHNRRHPDTPMKLKAVVVEINEEEALRRNIEENQERRDTTPMDHCMTQKRLRENFGWSDTQIAQLYKVSPA